MSQATSPSKMSPPDSTPQQCTEAPHPFNLSSADLILRTADLVDFRVHSLILALVSPFFATMLSLPQTPAGALSSPCPSCAAQGAKAGPGAPPVVPVPEDSTTLELLLRLVYPILKTHAQIEDPQVIVPVLLAATKYEMELPVQMLSERLIAITPKQPLQVWAAACRTGQESVARWAASTLRVPWPRNKQEEVLSCMEDLKDMSGVSAGDYFRLKLFLNADQATMDQGHLTLLEPQPAGSVSGHPAAVQPRPFATSLPSTDVDCQATSPTGISRHFSAHQVVLSIHSPVLEARLVERRNAWSNKPASDSSSCPARIELPFDEAPGVVSDLLWACYGGEGALPTDLTRLAGLLVASRKYEMVRVAREALVAWDAAADSRPLEAYFVAVSHGLSECAKAAAANVLTAPVSAHTYATAMDDAPALAYHRLLLYYDACRQAARKQADQANGQIADSLYIGGFTINTRGLKQRTSGFIQSTNLAPKGPLRKELRDILPATLFNQAHLQLLIAHVTSIPETILSAVDEVQIELP